MRSRVLMPALLLISLVLAALPALPALARSFSAEVVTTQLTLSAFFLGFAFAQLLCGPLSDRFGRRPVILGGLMLFVIASAACDGVIAVAAVYGVVAAARVDGVIACAAVDGVIVGDFRTIRDEIRPA